MNFTPIDLMERAIAQGEQARFFSAPNPWVGAVIVNGGVIVGEGHTQLPGLAHAEVEALTHAGERARGATLYVTLEPCSHVGRTPACTEAIIAAGISKVVYGVQDPDDQVQGRGIAVLRDAGIEVEVSECAQEVERQLAAYIWHRTKKSPYVVAKVASTLDGYVAMSDGTSQWITGEDARRDAHVLRAQSQAIVVGAGTVRSDNPRLTARLDDVTLEPLRVVLGEAPERALVHPCIEVSGSLEALLSDLYDRGVIQVLIEGGPRTTASFLEAGLINEFAWYVAPAFAGGAGSSPALPGIKTPTMEVLQRGLPLRVRQLGNDIRIDVEVSCR
jgi:diaminohydroxyphosphoribosylaminopyrimidine deaminase/5-amino-6-(5-phosphoribosylamino)uracil reductase